MDDHTATLNILSLFLVIVSIGAVATCLLTSWNLLRRKILVLTLLLGTLVSSTTAGATTSIAATRGLGRSLSNDAGDQLPDLFKAIYVSEIFHVITVGLGKLAFMVIFYTILSGSSLTTITRSISAVVCFLVLWTLTVTIVVSLQCQPPKVWNLSGKCFNLVYIHHIHSTVLLPYILLTCWKTTLWKYFGVMNIAIESLLFIVPSVLVYRLHMPLKKRLVAIAFLSVRTLNIVVSGIQLRHVSGFDNDRRSLSMSLWPWMMCSQVLHTVTIISACVPFLREFLESFPSGMFKPAGLDSTGSWHGSRSIRLLDSGSTP